MYFGSVDKFNDFESIIGFENLAHFQSIEKRHDGNLSEKGDSPNVTWYRLTPSQHPLKRDTTTYSKVSHIRNHFLR